VLGPHEETPWIDPLHIHLQHSSYIPLQSCSHFDHVKLGIVNIASNKWFGLRHITKDCKGMPHNELSRKYWALFFLLYRYLPFVPSMYYMYNTSSCHWHFYSHSIFRIHLLKICLNIILLFLFIFPDCFFLGCFPSRMLPTFTKCYFCWRTLIPLMLWMFSCNLNVLSYLVRISSQIFSYIINKIVTLPKQHNMKVYVE